MTQSRTPLPYALPIMPKGSEKHRAWYAKFLTTPDHALSLQDYVGPFPVGPAGYRADDVAELKAIYMRNEAAYARGELMLSSILPNKDRPDLVFRGDPDLYDVQAFDSQSGRLIGMISEYGAFRTEDTPHRGVAAELYRLISRAGSKSYSVVDFSEAGFKARVRAHGLVLNDALAAGIPLTAHATEGYGMTRGRFVLLDEPTPEEHNALWGVKPDPRFLAPDWYERRHELESGMVFKDYQDDLVKLDRRVEGDGTQWHVAVWNTAYPDNPHWSWDDTIIEPGDLREIVEDPEDRNDFRM